MKGTWLSTWSPSTITVSIVRHHIRTNSIMSVNIVDYQLTSGPIIKELPSDINLLYISKNIIVANIQQTSSLSSHDIHRMFHIIQAYISSHGLS